MHFIPQSKVLRMRHASVGKALPPDLSRIVAFESRQEAIISAAFTTFVEECRSDVVVNKFREAYTNTRMVHALAVTDEAVEDFSHVLETVFNNAGKFESNWLYKELDINQVKKIDVSPEVNLSFDPGSAEAARQMRASLLQFIREITDAQRKAIRAVLAQALEQGLGPTEAARLFRSKIGLTAYQMGAVDKYRSLLQSGSSEALSRTLRDRRFDSTIGRAIDQGVQLSTSQIERMVGRYQEKMLAMRAETIARTEMLSTVNAARHESIRQMANKVDLEMGRIQRTWRTTIDGRQRDTHFAMNRQVRGAEEHFVSPSGAKLMFPGDRTAPAAEVINCRCVLQVKILPPQESTAVMGQQPMNNVPPAYNNLYASHKVDFPSGAIDFQSNPSALSAFNQLNSQVSNILKQSESANLAAADKMLSAALKTAEALELAEAKAAKKYTDAVRAAAKARNVTTQSATKTVAGEKVVVPQKFKYGVPAQQKPAPVGTGKDAKSFLHVETNDDLAEISRDMYKEGLTSKLTAEEIKSLQAYTQSRFVTINKVDVEKRLRTPEYFDELEDLAREADTFIAGLDGAFAKAKLTEDLVVYRGMNAIRFREAFSGLRVGQSVVIDQALLSTSLSKQVAGRWAGRAQKPLILEILVPKGARALSLEPITLNKREFEILLDRNSKFLVREMKGNTVVLELLV